MRILLILLLAVIAAFGQQGPKIKRVVGRSLEGGHLEKGWCKIPFYAVPKESTNVVITITSGNWPKQPKIAKLEFMVSYNFDDIDRTWVKTPVDIDSSDFNSITLTFPLQPQRGNMRRHARCVFHANRNFDVVIEAE